MLIAEVTLGILLLVYPKQAEDIIKSGMEDVFKEYGTNEATDKSVDAIQSDVSHRLGLKVKRNNDNTIQCISTILKDRSHVYMGQLASYAVKCNLCVIFFFFSLSTPPCPLGFLLLPTHCILSTWPNQHNLPMLIALLMFSILSLLPNTEVPQLTWIQITRI